MHLQKKDKTEFGLGQSVILSLSEKLDGLYDNLYFDNLFISSMLVNNLYEKWIYCIGTVQRDRRNMAIMQNDSEMEQGETDF